MIISNVITVINIASNRIKWVAIVNPNKYHELKYKENAVHHIQESICKIKCLTFSSGMCLKGFNLEFITPCQLLFINSIITNPTKLQNRYYLVQEFFEPLPLVFQHTDNLKLLHLS